MIIYSNLLEDFKKLNDIFNLEELEGGLVRYFLYRNNFTTENVFIDEIIKKDKEERVFIYLKNLDKSINLSDLEKIFELMINPKDQQINGTVYTPNFIVDYIVDNTINESGTVCDLSCGSGAFLIGSLRRLKQLTNKSLINIIEENLFGIDILEYSIRRSKILLLLYAISNKEDKKNINFNLIVGDSLEINWNNVFKKNTFDYIVGNPPYVRIQDLSNVLKKRLSAKWQTTGSGNFNLYFPFFELGMKLLSENGNLGYIVPNNYFTSIAGKNLRYYLHSKKKIWRIINFNHLKIFQKASTYTCITLISNSYDKEFFEYYYLDKSSDLNNLNHLKFEKVRYNTLNDKKWRLLGDKDFENIHKIETAGIQIGKLFKIRVGIATLKDKIFFVNDSNEKYCTKNVYDNEYKIEKEVTRKIVKISSILKEEYIKKNNLRIIFPYKIKNNKYYLIPEDKLKTEYPLCYNYLLANKSQLASRDKGKKIYPSWYAYGRTQGFNYHGSRLYTRTFSNHPNFMLDEENDSLFCNGYAVFIDKNIGAYQKILNSKIMDYYIKKTSVEIEGNFQCYQKNFIEKFTIPTLSEEDIDYLNKEENKEKIDRWLVKKYELLLL